MASGLAAWLLLHPWQASGLAGSARGLGRGWVATAVWRRIGFAAGLAGRGRACRILRRSDASSAPQSGRAPGALRSRAGFALGLCSRRHGGPLMSTTTAELRGSRCRPGVPKRAGTLHHAPPHARRDVAIPAEDRLAIESFTPASPRDVGKQVLFWKQNDLAACCVRPRRPGYRSVFLKTRKARTRPASELKRRPPAGNLSCRRVMRP